MARIFSGQRAFLHPVLRPLECIIYRLLGIDEGSEMSWKNYSLALIVFNLVGIIVLSCYS